MRTVFHANISTCSVVAETLNAYVELCNRRIVATNV